MCIIVDINSLHCVFNPNSNLHQEFKPVLDWIISGKGKLVYGGSTYLRELKKTKKYFKIIIELNRINKVMHGDDSKIDSAENTIKDTIADDGFNDHHIAAIIIVTKCKLVCTSDSKSIPYLKNKSLFPKSYPNPKFYLSKKNVSLLNNNNIVDCCKFNEKITKEIQNNFYLLMK